MAQLYICSVWNWEQQQFLAYFPSGHRKLGGKVRVTALQFINEQDSSALLLSGTDDGVVSIYSDFAASSSWSTGDDDEPGGGPTVVSSWRALDLLPDETSPGLQLTYQPMNGTLIAGGDQRIVKIWDLEKELCVQVYLPIIVSD